VIYANPDMFSPVKRAWAIWMLANRSYGSKLDGSFGYCRKGTSTRKINGKRESFTIDCANRLQNVQIECGDALRIIKSRDTPTSFFYLDPPYVGADQGHYDGYTQEDFDRLLEVLETVKGKFLLSSYPNHSLSDFINRNMWSSVNLKMASTMTHGFKTQRTKTEVLTANYPIAVPQ
jgi:DNA adenine methylase